MKALAKIKADGGIKKYDPNAVKKKLSPKAQQNIKKRILEKGRKNVLFIYDIIMPRYIKL